MIRKIVKNETYFSMLFLALTDLLIQILILGRICIRFLVFFFACAKAFLLEFPIFPLFTFLSASPGKLKMKIESRA